MTSSSPANTQVRALLQTLCNCILPFIQTGLGQTIDLKDIRFGIEADEFGIELEKFISGIISRSQPHNQVIVIEARSDKDTFYYSEEGEVTIGARSDDKGDLEHPPADQNIIQHHPAHQLMPVGSAEEVLGNQLQSLRKHVTQTMPIRLLYFEPHNSKLKISLLERTEIYDRLALKLRSDFTKEPFIDYVGWWKSEHAGYAILSHTWNQSPGELTYGDWQKGSLGAAHPKCQKLINFCKVAWEDYGLAFGWIDTVCINKESSAELDESIRSMYAWYRNADVCITYLAATNTLLDMHNDPWFSRGWTLQELVAPWCIKFYNMDWKPFSKASENDKGNHSIQSEISRATTITPNELRYIWEASISRRMQLAANRQVTREEDMAYCLMGIFDVSISTAYGEGADRAFSRLVEEIFHSTKDITDIFNWSGGRAKYFRNRQPTTSLFPIRPSDYLNRSSDEQLRQWRPIEPLTLTHLGLRTPILLMPAVGLSESLLPDSQPIGDYHAAVSVAPYDDDIPRNYLLLLSGQDIRHKFTNEVIEITLTFGTLNVEEQGTSIRIPKTCLAVLLKREVEPLSMGYKKIYTKKPIVFDLKKIGNSSNDDIDKDYYEVKRSQLANHGMQLVTLIL